jgi:hypothetical protein
MKTAKPHSEGTAQPRFAFRAVKFNLPWSPYRVGQATDLHIRTCRDLGFWERFPDMMVSNRFNALTLWNLHPFPYRARPEGFERACGFDDNELAGWRRFWHGLFRLAAERGIETTIVNRNIVVSPEFAAAYGVAERNDTSQIVRDYTRQRVTQVINEYEELSGLGVTLADWMAHMAPAHREDWMAETFVAGMKAASRPVKFIHRSALAGSPSEMRKRIDKADLPDPVLVEVKFNGSHGHSTPRLAMYHSRRICAGISWWLFELSRDVNALDDCIAHETRAIEAWKKLVAAAGDIYTDDLAMGGRVFDMAGHWRDALKPLCKGLAALQGRRQGLKATAKRSPQIAHVPVRRAKPGRGLVIRATVRTSGGPARVCAGYGDETAGYRYVKMKPAKAPAYRATIPAKAVSRGLMYFIEAMDNAGNGRIRPNLEIETPYVIVRLQHRGSRKK